MGCINMNIESFLSDDNETYFKGKSGYVEIEDKGKFFLVHCNRYNSITTKKILLKQDAIEFAKDWVTK